MSYIFFRAEALAVEGFEILPVRLCLSHDESLGCFEQPDSQELLLQNVPSPQRGFRKLNLHALSAVQVAMMELSVMLAYKSWSRWLVEPAMRIADVVCMKTLSSQATGDLRITRSRASGRVDKVKVSHCSLRLGLSWISSGGHVQSFPFMACPCRHFF